MAQGQLNTQGSPSELLQKTVGFYQGDIRELSSLNLAYIGDAVFEILVRTTVLNQHKTTGNNLHLASKEYVKAHAQSVMYYKIKAYLSDEEYSVLKRGRNTKTHSKAKNASVNDYRHATGLEALFGYLYLKGDMDRIMDLFNRCIDENELKELTIEEEN